MTATSAHRTVFVTHRPPIHQRLALEAAPPSLAVEILVSPTHDELVAAVPGAEFLVSERAGVIDERVLAAGSSLRLVQRLGRQVHDIDIDAATRLGVPVCSWPLPLCARVAEHVIFQILALSKRSRAAEQLVIDGRDFGPPQRCDADTFAINWAGMHDVRQIAGSTVAIIGFGEIGSELAVRLAAMGADVRYHRRTKLPDWAEQRLGVTYGARDELLATADTVVLLLPHAPDTEGCVDRAFVASMRAGALLVSAGASTLLDEAAVASAYTAGHLGGVATDGYRWEPVRGDNPLMALAADPSANVVLTPHSAQGHVVLGPDLRRGDYTNLIAVLDGSPLQHRVA